MKLDLPRMLFHKEVRTVDFERIKVRYSNEAEIAECFNRIHEALEEIRRSPQTIGRQCLFEPLKPFRKFKLHSSKDLKQKIKTDMRIIFRYNEAKNAVEILSIGFRVKDKPRPPEDVYSIAEAREFVF